MEGREGGVRRTRRREEKVWPDVGGRKLTFSISSSESSDVEVGEGMFCWRSWGEVFNLSPATFFFTGLRDELRAILVVWRTNLIYGDS